MIGRLPLIKKTDEKKLKKDYFSEINDNGVYRRYSIDELASKYKTTPLLLEKFIQIKGWDKERLSLELKNQSTDLTRTDLFLESAAEIDTKLLNGAMLLLDNITQYLKKTSVQESEEENDVIFNVDSTSKLISSLKQINDLSQSVLERINKERSLAQGKIKLQGSYEEIENLEKCDSLMKEIQMLESGDA